MQFLCWLLCWQLPTTGYQLSFFWFSLFCFSLRYFMFILDAAVLYRKAIPWTSGDTFSMTEMWMPFGLRTWTLSWTTTSFWLLPMESVFDWRFLEDLGSWGHMSICNHPCYPCSVHGVLVLQLRKHCAMLFEVFDLQYASPATVSRCGMLYVAWLQVGLDWWWLVKSWWMLIVYWCWCLYAHLR